MNIWTWWLDSLQTAIFWLADDVGLGLGLAVIAVTLALRLGLLPLSWFTAYSACVRSKRLQRLAPELEQLKQKFRDNPERLIQATFERYRDKGIRFVELRPLLSGLAQMPVLLGMFNALRRGLVQARFLWVQNLARPDFLLAVIAGITTAMLMLANPDLPEQTRQLMLWLPSVLAFVFALKFASALALYWIASNLFTAAQTVAVHYVVNRRIASGAIRL